MLKYRDHRPNGFGPDVWSVWTWYRDCLAGHSTKPDCRYCQQGNWHFTLLKPFDQWVFKKHYRLWYWWHNRPNSRSKKHLKAKFERLR